MILNTITAYADTLNNCAHNFLNALTVANLALNLNTTAQTLPGRKVNEWNKTLAFGRLCSTVYSNKMEHGCVQTCSAMRLRPVTATCVVVNGWQPIFHLMPLSPSFSNGRRIRQWQELCESGHVCAIGTTATSQSHNWS